MRFLVTGASGFVGGHLIELLRAERHEIVSLSRDGDVDHRVDITNARAVREACEDGKIDGIFHLAAIAFVPDAARDAGLAEDVNVTGTSNVLDAAAAVGAKAVVVSSGAVYGDGEGVDPPFDERSPLRPRGVYAETKARAEAECEKRATTQSIIRVRAFNHTGPGQAKEYVCSGFAEQVVAIKMGLRPPVMYVGDLSAERDFCDVRDTVRAYLAAFDRGAPGDVYNVCSGTPRRIRSILDFLIDSAGIEVDVRVDEQRLRGDEVSRLWGSNEKAREELGWSPVLPWRRTLADLLAWWTERHLAASRSA